MKNVGNVHLGPDLRRGVAELDGKGEMVGGIVVMRYGENALTVIDGVKKKFEEIKKALAGRRRDRADLRPEQPDPQCHRHPARKADRGKHRRGFCLDLIPLACPLRAGGHHHAARSRSFFRFCRCSG